MNNYITWLVFTAILTLLSSTSAVAATSCHVDYKIRTQWGNGFTTDVTIQNTGDALSAWEVRWDMPNAQRITGIWNASHQQNQSQVTVNNVNWNKNVAAGANIQFGFNGSHNGDNQKPHNITLNGVQCSGQQAPPPPPPAEPVECEVNYHIRNQWGTGFTTDVTIQNTGGKLDGWEVTWDMLNEQRITGIWNAAHQQQNAQVTVNNLSWNKNIAKGGQIAFGFNGSHNGTNHKPYNIKVNGVLCSGQQAPPPPQPIACSVNYHIREQWGTGFTTDVTIHNTGRALDGWEVTWSMPYQQKITQVWNGSYTQQADQVSIKPADWNKQVGSDAKLEFGFNASHNGLNPKPIDLAVNGVRCEGQNDAVLLPPLAPSDLNINLVANQKAELSWTDHSDNEANFVLQRRPHNGNWQTLATLAANTTQYTDEAMQVGTAYQYQVQAVNDTGASSFTNSVSAKRQDRTDIRAPVLANSCASCHGTQGISSGPSIPSISGLDRDYFIRTMQAYQDGSRASSVMDRIAKGYTDQQIERMADYFAALPFVAAEQTTEQSLVDKGRTIHETRCIFCHSGTGEDDTLTETRLDGRWSTYLHATMEDYYAERSSNQPDGMRSQMQGIKAAFGEDALHALAEYYAASAQDKQGGDNNGGDDGSGDDGNNNGGGDDTGNDGDPNTIPSPATKSSLGIVDNAVVNLNWQDNSNNETGFRIERSTNGSDNWEVLHETTANTASYSDSSVQMGQDYSYRISAFNTAGVSSATTAIEASLPSLLKYGELKYQQQGCASCHGSDGSGGFTNRPLTAFGSERLHELSDINRLTMPPANPAACEGNCALATAHYIVEVLATQGGDSNNNNQACENVNPPSERSLRLLTRQEYQNTVKDLLGLNVNLIHDLPEENRVDGYDNNIEHNQVTAARLEGFLLQADKLANQAVQQSWNHLLPCSSENASCAQQFIREFGLKAYRRPLTAMEVSDYYLRFTQTGFRDAVEDTVMKLLLSPNFLYRSELGELQADGSYQLTQYEIASSLSYLFLGSMPDAELFQAAANNELSNSAQRIAQASRLLNNPRSRQQVGNFVGQWLLGASPYSLPDKDLTVYPGYTSEVRAAMSQEMIRFFNHVAFDSSQSYNELLTADYVMANKALADFYQLTGPSGDTFEYTPVDNGTRTGILTLGAVLSRYANSAESHPFKRGAFFYKRMLCHDLPAPENAGVVEPPTPDPNATTRERFEFHSESMPSCYSCHQYLDGPGFSFESYDGVGQFRALENGNPIDTAGILRGLETYTPEETVSFNDLQQLSALVSSSDNAAQCVARQYYRYTTGRRESSADSCVLDSFIQTYADNGYNLQTMLLGIVSTPAFTLRHAE